MSRKEANFGKKKKKKANFVNQFAQFLYFMFLKDRLLIAVVINALIWCTIVLLAQLERNY